MSFDVTSQPSFLRPAWCEIDLDAIERNVRQLKEIIGPAVKLFVCLKGDALGCGAQQVAQVCEQAGAQGLAFANIDTALACRPYAQNLPMLLYPCCLPQMAGVLEQHRLSATISTLDDVHRWAMHVSSGIDVFLKIDTGGLRAGAFPGEAVDVAKAIVSTGKLRLAGVYGHSLASYHRDESGAGVQPLQQQVDVFLGCVQQMESAGIEVPIRMFASSESVLSCPSADMNAVEPGRLIAGLDFPAADSRLRSWHPALVGLKSRIVMRKALASHLEADAGALFPIRAGMVIGLIPLGWSDGYPRRLPAGATVLVNGQRAPVLGPVHSELLRIDLTDVPDAVVGDEVVLLGSSGGQTITLQELQQQWGMDMSELFLTVGRRLPRVFRRTLTHQGLSRQDRIHQPCIKP